MNLEIHPGLTLGFKYKYGLLSGVFELLPRIVFKYWKHETDYTGSIKAGGITVIFAWLFFDFCVIFEK